MAIVSYYKLWANSTDSVWGFNGTDTNITYWNGWPTGVRASFNWSSSFIQVASWAMNNLTAGTYFIWFNITNVANTNTFTHKLNSGVSNYFLARTSGTSTMNYLVDQTSFSTSKTLSSNTWQRVAVRWDWSNVVSFLNWVQDTTTASTKSIPNNSQVIHIGKDSNNALYTNGFLAEMRIENTAMTAAEIKNDYIKYLWFF